MIENKVLNSVSEEINNFFVGKEDVVENILICVLAGGHILLEDIPGVGKTTLSKAFAKVLGLDFGRIQFTPDTLPSDVTGLSVYNMKSGEFEFHEGAVMHQFVLADEINRTSPKTQAALLEAMAEGQVTAEGRLYKLPSPFVVIATQNPIEYLGTYPLPEAELDRFMMRLSIGYPSEQMEQKMVKSALSDIKVENIKSILSKEGLLEIQREVEKVLVSDVTLQYAYNIVELTRKEESFVTGASPRALIQLVKASMANAYLNGRDYVIPDDVKKVAANVLNHRLPLSQEAKIRKEDSKKLLTALTFKAKVPTEK